MNSSNPNKKGIIYMVPCPIGPNNPLDVLPTQTIEVIHSLKHFFAENLKTTRHTLKACNHPLPIREIEIDLLDKNTSEKEVLELIKCVENGENAGMMSEAGCPGIADPGSILVKVAHQKNIRVIPLIGPSSILLALMASGFSGQSFVFHGYLQKNINDLKKQLQQLEQQSNRLKQSQIFIETPYRTNNLIETITHTCGSNTLFCVAYNLNQSDETVISKPIQWWKKNPIKLDKEPCVFILFVP